MSFQVRRIFTRELHSTLLSTLNVYNFTTTSIRHVIVRIVGYLNTLLSFFGRYLFACHTLSLHPKTAIHLQLLLCCDLNFSET
jgi:hypothetical protein